MDIEYISRKSGIEQPSVVSLPAGPVQEPPGFFPVSTGKGLYYAENGTIALFSFLITMLLCLGLVQEKKTSIAMRFSLIGGTSVYALANLAAIFLVNLAFFGAASIITGSMPPLHAMLSYIFFISVFGICLGNLIKSESIFLGLTIVGFLATAVLGGVFVDIGGLIQSLDPIKYLFATHYFMEGLRGSGIYLTLVGAGAVMICGLCVVKRVRVR